MAKVSFLRNRQTFIRLIKQSSGTDNHSYANQIGIAVFKIYLCFYDKQFSFYNNCINDNSVLVVCLSRQPTWLSDILRKTCQARAIFLLAIELLVLYQIKFQCVCTTIRSTRKIMQFHVLAKPFIHIMYVYNSFFTFFIV